MEGTKLSQLSSSIHEAIQNQDNERALRLILANFDKVPESGPLREKVALILASEGRKKEAVEILQTVARHYANAGFPVRAIAAARQMLRLNPDTTELLDHIATLYNIRSPFLSQTLATMGFPESANLTLEPDGPDGDFDGLLLRAVERSLDRSSLAQSPKQLPALPLLSLLPENGLRRALELLEYEVYDLTQRVTEKGKRAEDLVWTVSDDLVMRDGPTIRYVGAGALLGVASFGTSARESKVDVFAQPGCEILRMTQEGINAMKEDFADFGNRLATLRRHSMTERLLRRHKMFDNLDDASRVKIIETFSGYRVEPGSVLIKQNTPSSGLFIILDGKVDIVRDDDGWEITIATLGAGDVFGEIGLVADTPAVAGCVMNESGHILHLPRADFQALRTQYPSVDAYMKELAEERLADVATTLSADDLAEVD